MRADAWVRTRAERGACHVGANRAERDSLPQAARRAERMRRQFIRGTLAASNVQMPQQTRLQARKIGPAATRQFGERIRRYVDGETANDACVFVVRRCSGPLALSEGGEAVSRAGSRGRASDHPPPSPLSESGAAAPHYKTLSRAHRAILLDSESSGPAPELRRSKKQGADFSAPCVALN